MWPFNKPEIREYQPERDFYQSEPPGSPYAPYRRAKIYQDAGTLAVVEACAGLWERAFESATVQPMNNLTSGLTPTFFGIVARALAMRGECLFLIRLDGMNLRLIPANSFDVISGSAEIMTWVYRADTSGPSSSRSEYLGGDAVLHFRIGTDVKQPWRGRSPLSRGSKTAALAAQLEESLTLELKTPIGRIAPISGNEENRKQYWNGLSLGGLTVYGSLSSAGQEHARDFKPVSYGPEPDQFSIALRTDLSQDIAAAFGVPASFFSPGGDGAGQREAWRRFLFGTIAPIGRVIEAECKAKLDPSIIIGHDAMRASDEDGRSRAIMRRAAAFKTLTDAGFEKDEARKLSGL